jgi:hypothetical protein
MRRKFFMAASLLSLLLCTATSVLWVRSYTTFDDLDHTSTSLTPSDFTQHYIRLGSNNGRFLFTWRDITFLSNFSSFAYVTSTWDRANGLHFKHNPPFNLDLEMRSPRQPNERSWDTQLGGIRFKRLIQDATPRDAARRLGYRPANYYPGMIGVVVIVPHAYVAALFAILPVVALRKWWRRPRRGMCPICRYDLTGNTSGVCPECGSSVAGGKAVKT